MKVFDMEKTVMDFLSRRSNGTFTESWRFSRPTLLSGIHHKEVR